MGDLVARASGDAWFGSIPYVTQRLADLQQRHADAQAGLDWALLDATEHERLAVERAKTALAQSNTRTAG